MPSLNKVILIGRLTRDPELAHTQGGKPVASFSIAVDRPFKNQAGEKITDFFNCKAWRQKAEFVDQYIKKGRLVAVEGRIELNRFTGQDGTPRTSIDIVCDQVETLDKAQGDGDGGAEHAPQGNRAGGSKPRPAAAPSAYPDDLDDSDPFAD